MMQQLVRMGKKNVDIRQAAVELTRNLPQKDYVAEVKTLFYFVRDQIRYVRDIKGVETVHTAERVLSNGAGDCDDKSVLLAALLESIGHPTGFRAVGFKAGNFSHVLVITRIGSKWIPLETTEPVEMGWQPKNIVSSMEIYN